MDAWYFLVIFVALAAGAVVKGATGMGLPLVALPALTAAFGLTHAIGLMVVPVLVSNIWQVVRLWAQRTSPGLDFLPRFIVGVSVGVVAGTWLLKTLPERWLVVALGLMLVGYVVIRLARPSLKVSPELAKCIGLPVGAAAGVLNGATGISAPIGVTFIHWMGLARDAHVFVVSVMFLVMGAVQLPAMFAAGLMQPFWLVEGVLALVPIVLFMPVGRLIVRHMSREAFDRLVLVVLGLIGVKMLAGL
jgi:uncharacterized membrane protein YfcA